MYVHKEEIFTKVVIEVEDLYEVSRLKMYCYIEYYLICTLSYRNAKFGNLHRLLAIDLFCCFTLNNNKRTKRRFTLKSRQAGEKNAILYPVIIQKHPCRPIIKLTEQA